MSYVFAQYCDDIRYELGGKHSLMGIYFQSLISSDFPLALPRFCVIASIVVPAELEILEPIQIRVLRDEVEIKRAQAEQPAETPSDVRVEGAALKMWVVHFQFANLIIDEPCKFRVLAEINGEEYRGASLLVRQGEIDGGPPTLL